MKKTLLSKQHKEKRVKKDALLPREETSPASELKDTNSFSEINLNEKVLVSSESKIEFEEPFLRVPEAAENANEGLDGEVLVCPPTVAEILIDAEQSSSWEQQWKSRPKMRGWLHAISFPVALTTTLHLVKRRPNHRKAVSLYAAGLSSMFAASAFYHRITPNEKWMLVTRATDHAMIFAAIAGTTTPIAAVVLPRGAVGPAIASIWGAAALGAVGRINDLRRNRKGLSPSTVSYGILGWLAIAFLPELIKKTGWGNAALIISGGAAYTIGAIMFSQQKPVLYPKTFGYHEVWHTATLVGATTQLIAIARITKD